MVLGDGVPDAYSGLSGRLFRLIPAASHVRRLDRRRMLQGLRARENHASTASPSNTALPALRED